MRRICYGIIALVLTTPVFAAGTPGEATRNFIVGIADNCKTNELSSAAPDYTAAVYASGAVPFMLPCTTNAELMAAALDCVDMLLIQGGEDVQPSRYGEQPHEKLSRINPRRDDWEFALVAEARKRRLPILGICRGSQVLNVAFGGTLWQDLGAQKEGADIHANDPVEHGITVEKGSYLASLAGEKCSVNSYHHQAVKELAKGFKVVAMSTDGVVEAFEGEDYPAMGVQFHPEKMFVDTGRKEFLPIFRGAFAKAARKRGARRRKLVIIPDYCATNGWTNAKISMSDAIGLAGFVSVVLPYTKGHDDRIAAVVADADAVMIAGGMGRRQDYVRRCAFEDRVLKFAIPRKMPVAGICHGSQIINRFMGGTIEFTPQWKDPERKTGIMHRPVPWNNDNYHLTNVEPDSRFGRIMGEERVRINSYHSKRSVKMAKGLVVTSRADDGTVEAFEHKTLPIMAFQFHPERMTEDPRFVELIRSALSPLASRP